MRPRDHLHLCGKVEEEKQRGGHPAGEGRLCSAAVAALRAPYLALSALAAHRNGSRIEDFAVSAGVEERIGRTGARAMATQVSSFSVVSTGGRVGAAWAGGSRSQRGGTSVRKRVAVCGLNVHVSPRSLQPRLCSRFALQQEWGVGSHLLTMRDLSEMEF